MDDRIIDSIFPIEEVRSGSGAHPAIVVVEADVFHTGNMSEPGNFQEMLAIAIQLFVGENKEKQIVIYILKK